jgi:hypothetical protein
MNSCWGNEEANSFDVVVLVSIVVVACETASLVLLICYSSFESFFLPRSGRFFGPIDADSLASDIQEPLHSILRFNFPRIFWLPASRSSLSKSESLGR